MESSRCWPVQTSWQRIHRACWLLLGFHGSTKLKENTFSSEIELFKEQFSRHGIPDNALQFTSHEFHQFSVDWEFTHVSSSLHYHRSNGKADSAVKIVKSLFRKSLKDNKDLWLALLDQHNTLTEFLESSPAQRLISRCTRTLLQLTYCTPRFQKMWMQSWNWKGKRLSGTMIAYRAPHQNYKLGKR